ncbi:zf-TFIIB domain-containing protein [Oscillatoria salina]|uniref:zf-TFIIB domain-containing protein n=1 Tax=Oscillatoria salina TaxID=331517 RepID=UPI0013BE7D71|nr:zf-TFIIB domain-containing protein [Oscillatoria salina]MBZ8179785.1 zf-TFIIB domain-containing protein [Oscillatoria salina IIICB1]NET87704.1 zf-TFIIB domain-containing protein [Kamptonema sp. SIO1D9]
MQCPKCRKVALVDGTLSTNLAAKQCPQCQGSWLSGDEYETWQAKQHQPVVPPDFFSKNLDVNFTQSPLDAKAALCPECGRYLARAKVSIRNPFYVERCPQCQGIWCDRGEWDILTKLGIHTTLDRLFSTEWQFQLQKQQSAEKERQTTVEKLGPELAQKVFELGEILQDHPHGDFALAYLMRQVAQSHKQ